MTTVLSIVATDSTFRLQPGNATWVGRCIHCGSKLVVSTEGATDATIEHIRPLCSGGTSDPENLALACKGCNNEKGVRHDRHAGKGGRADEVIVKLQATRASRMRAT